MSMIPTTTGAARAIGEVIPEVKGKLDGFAIRVPTPTVSLVDFVANLAKGTTKEAVNDAFRKWASGPMKGIMLCVEDELVSSDFIGCPYSSCVDMPTTNVMGGTFVKVLSWYDNEWGFSTRMAETIAYVMR
jgi:glyceraldehyde 3-phosphate dehydrogenase